MREEKRDHNRQEGGTVLQGSLVLRHPWDAAITKRPDKETPSSAEPSQDRGQVV